MGAGPKPALPGRRVGRETLGGCLRPIFRGAQGSPFSASRVSLLPMSDEFPSWAAERPNWVRVWIGLLGLWATFIVLGTCFNYQSLLARGHPISWIQAVRMNLVAYGIWAFLLTPLVLSLCARFPLGRRGLFKLVSFLSIAATVCIDVCIKTLLERRVFRELSPAFVTQFRRYVLRSGSRHPDHNLFLIGVIGYVVAYYGALRAQESHAAELETNLVRAELQVLKIQLQPHFLFNTLHSVAALVRKDPSAAEKMICSLGDLLRLTCSRGNSGHSSTGTWLSSDLPRLQKGAVSRPPHNRDQCRRR